MRFEYVPKDGDLFLSLMADGGITSEPVSNSGATPAPPGSARTGPVIYTCTNAKGEREEDQSNLSPNRYAVGSRQTRRSNHRGVGVPFGAAPKYEGPDLMFWEHQGEAMVTWMNVELTCKPSKSAGHIGRT